MTTGKVNPQTEFSELRAGLEPVQVPPPMTRIAAVAMLVVGVVLAGCSGSELCGPSTCDGCCTADGVCVAGDSQAACGDNGLWCQACSGAQTCQAGFCRAPAVEDAGTPDGGHEEADAGVVFVTMRYEYLQKSGECPNYTQTVQPCSAAKVMAKPVFDALRSDYAECAITQPTSDGYTIDCGSCVASSGECIFDNGQDGGSRVDISTWTCPMPAHTSATACQWDVP